VVGINSMVVGGFGVAVTSGAVERWIGDKRRSLGVTVRPVELREAGLPRLGLMVVELEAGGAAHLSGVLIGDVIVGVNGKSLNSPEQLSDAIQAATNVLPLDLLRQGRRKLSKVTLARSVAEVA
jgi:S1-C subfamily serine protease